MIDLKEEKAGKYTDAILEAIRFISKAKVAKLRIKEKHSLAYITGCKETAAAKRSSMDLTRALAELRRP